jgi:hypothetical protein
MPRRVPGAALAPPRRPRCNPVRRLTLGSRVPRFTDLQNARSRPGTSGGALGWVGKPEDAVENPQQQPPQSLQVELSEREAEGIYSNLVLIAHSASEVILDFARHLPGLPKAKIYARVILTPQHAKSLLLTLEQNLKTYEGQFGPIKLPGDKPTLGFKS